MNGFEIFNQVNSGEKFFKAIMSVIHPDDCVVDGKGTKFNINGCTWIEEYVDRNKETLIDKSITVEFTDEERTQINGHGLTGFSDMICCLQIIKVNRTRSSQDARKITH